MVYLVSCTALVCYVTVIPLFIKKVGVVHLNFVGGPDPPTPSGCALAKVGIKHETSTVGVMLCVEGETGRRLRHEYSAAGREVCRPDDVRNDDVFTTITSSHPRRFTTLDGLSERGKGPPTKLCFKSGYVALRPYSV